MKIVKVVVLLTSLFAPQIGAFVIESAIVTVAVPTLAYLGSKAYCQFKECCTEKWISPNITGLQSGQDFRTAPHIN